MFDDSISPNPDAEILTSSTAKLPGQVDSFPGLGREMMDGDFSPEKRPALDDIYGVKYESDEETKTMAA